MSQMMIIFLMLVLAGCATDTEPKMTAEALIPLVREHAFREKPELDPLVQFKVEEYRVEGLQEALKIQLFLARYMSPDGQQFNEGLLIYHDGKLMGFASALGGHGLMSAVMIEDALYYTYSWGSGRHRSHIGQLSIDGGEIRILDSGGYMSTDLFVRKAESGIQVEAGRFHGFNSWEPAEEVGWVKIKASSLAIVDAAGAEVPAGFAIMKQGIQQPTKPDKFFPADSLGHLALAEVGTFWADDKAQLREDKSGGNFQRDAASLGGLRLRGKNKSIAVAVFRTQKDAIRAMEELREDVASVIIPGDKHSLFPGLWWYTSGIPNAVFVNHENTIVRVSCYQPKYDKSKHMLIRTAAEVVDRISKESKENTCNQQMHSTPTSAADVSASRPATQTQPAMGKLLKVLEPQRKQWQKAAPGKPAAKSLLTLLVVGIKPKYAKYEPIVTAITLQNDSDKAANVQWPDIWARTLIVELKKDGTVVPPQVKWSSAGGGTEAFQLLPGRSHTTRVEITDVYPSGIEPGKYKLALRYRAEGMTMPYRLLSSEARHRYVRLSGRGQLDSPLELRSKTTEFEVTPPAEEDQKAFKAFFDVMRSGHERKRQIELYLQVIKKYPKSRVVPRARLELIRLYALLKRGGQADQLQGLLKGSLATQRMRNVGLWQTGRASEEGGDLPRAMRYYRQITPDSYLAVRTHRRARAVLKPRLKALAQQRLAAVKKSCKTHQLMLLRFHGQKRNVRPAWVFGSPVPPAKPSPLGPPYVQITEAQAGAVLKVLTASGFFERALSFDMADPHYDGPVYSLQVHTAERFYEENLGYDRKTWQVLGSLRKALAGNPDAIKAMDKLLKALEPQRKKWLKDVVAADVAASRPATQPGAALPPKTVKAVKALLAKAELVVLGKVAAAHDRTARDAGMLYDIEVNKILKGKWQEKSLSFRSTGWVGYAKYTKGQGVLLFLRRWGDKKGELLQLKPIVYISPPPAGALDLRPVEKYLKLIKSLQPGGDKPATRAVDRARLLKQHVDKFSLTLKHINPNGPNIRPVVRFTVPEMGARVRTWRISKAQAVKLIDHLAAEGFLASSRDIFVTKAPEIAGPYCVLSVGGLPRVSLEENLGWNLKMLGRLDALLKVLDGKAGKAMAEFIKALEPQRKQWQKASATKTLDLDATVKLLTKRVGGKWQKDAHNAFLPTKRVVRGYVYLATDKVRVSYTVYPLELFDGRTPVLSTLRMCGNAEILGVSPVCVVTVFSTAPADKVAPYSRAVTKALTLKPPKVMRRAMQAADVMKKNVAGFTLTLRYHGPQDKPHYRLLLTAVPIERKERPFEMIRFLDAKQAEKIIDHLAEEGFLAAAANIESKKVTYPKGPACTMTITGHGVLYQDLGWDLKMLQRLDGLQKVLDKDSAAAKAMDKLLEALEPQRKK